jgi:hypothetical protein
MVRRSNRSITVSNLSDEAFSHWVFADVMKLIDSSSSEEVIDGDDSDDDNEFWYDTKFISAIQLSMVHGSRYLFRTPHRGDVRRDFSAPDVNEWEKIVFGNRYNDDEFLELFRVPRHLFMPLVDLFRGHPAFGVNGKKQRKHFCIELHFLILLKYLGTQGNGGSISQLKLGLGIGRGSVYNYLRRAIDAVVSKYSAYVFWPEADERKEISDRIRKDKFFPKCVGFIDGTHLGLAFKPTKDGEEYFTRKQSYAVAALVSCDDMRRIRYLNVGWPGSVHDQRIFSNSKLTINVPNMYSPQEYLLGDSAFTPTSFLVPAYKKYGGKVQLTAGQKFFNDLVSSARCQVEHTIGIWKGRFPFLREIRLRIRGKRDMQMLIKLVKVSAVLHNLLVRRHTVPQTWFSKMDNVDVDIEEELDADNYLSVNCHGNHTTRREEVHNFLSALLQ